MMKVAVILFVMVQLAVTVHGKPQLHQQVPQLGLSNLTRIMHGEDAKIADYPYQVYILANVLACGGSIISTNFVLTAAHCFKNISGPSDVIVRAGSSQSNSGGQTIRAKSIDIHPNYDEGHYFDCDCAVIELASSLIFGEGVRPIQLQPASYKILDGQQAVVTGWGSLGGGVSPNVLQVMTTPVKTTETCQHELQSNSYFITSMMICAGLPEKNACFGDSGGPLVVTDGFQVGILSHLYSGRDCGSTPTIYTKVSEMLPFINRFVKTY